MKFPNFPTSSWHPSLPWLPDFPGTQFQDVSRWVQAVQKHPWMARFGTITQASPFLCTAWGDTANRDGNAQFSCWKWQRRTRCHPCKYPILLCQETNYATRWPNPTAPTAGYRSSRQKHLGRRAVGPAFVFYSWTRKLFALGCLCEQEY